MMGRFLRIGVYGRDMSTTRTTLTPEQDWETNVKNSWRNPNCNLGDKSGTSAKRETLVEPAAEPPRPICPTEPKTPLNLEWNFGGTLGEPSAEPLGSPRRICPTEPETPRNLEWNFGGTLVELWWNLGGTLVEPSAEPFGSPRRICPREPERVRKQFCPETFTMAEDPKAIAVGKTYSNYLNLTKL